MCSIMMKASFICQPYELLYRSLDAKLVVGIPFKDLETAASILASAELEKVGLQSRASCSIHGLVVLSIDDAPTPSPWLATSLSMRTMMGPPRPWPIVRDSPGCGAWSAVCVASGCSALKRRGSAVVDHGFRSWEFCQDREAKGK
ncbi:uncharacterized protein [Triticum aestivum]|nr:uncharacterized protein LOC123162794 isoform X2 [Triticum aestivum]